MSPTVGGHFDQMARRERISSCPGKYAPQAVVAVRIRGKKPLKITLTIFKTHLITFQHVLICMSFVVSPPEHYCSGINGHGFPA